MPFELLPNKHFYSSCSKNPVFPFAAVKRRPAAMIRSFPQPETACFYSNLSMIVAFAIP
ncbi:hypothetical protein B4096_3249 [Heyndrickxia coagulans]|nr:hypothetical protein B4096_3249 [Heyndrickxia coagulans]